MDDVASAAEPLSLGINWKRLRKLLHTSVVVFGVIHHKAAKFMLNLIFLDDRRKTAGNVLS
jgi:hypothetical protein